MVFFWTGMMVALIISSLLALDAGAGSSSSFSFIQKNADPLSCRSNATHIVWKQEEQERGTTTLATMPAFASRRAHVLITSTDDQKNDSTTSTSPSSCIIQSRSQAEQDCLQFLKTNLMAFDLPFQTTMGFPSDENDVDGLGHGLIEPTIRLALDAKVQYEWTDDLPQSLFFDYVLNYANLNEARNNWRPLLTDTLNFTSSALWASLQQRQETMSHPTEQEEQEPSTTSVVVTWVNTHLWTMLGRPGSPIFFQSGQTPLIFDPMSTIAYGYASCTGTSILFANALRAVGVAARVVGTPAWYGKPSNGNHNWVEVYDADGTWKFLEPSPALDHVDTIDADPCSRWFCDATRYPSSRVYAARLSKASSISFPLAWEWDCEDVPAEDRTQYYTDICKSCGGD